MATIRATCADCGDVEITSDEVVVRVCVDNGHGSYTFRCPGCGMAVAKPAEPRIVELLIASGVRLHRWRLPAELDEQRVGDPIDHDDLLDFHRLLGDDGRLTTELGRLVEG
ncbi:hypothetical protein PO878_10830 [Iamia majanohamensis]|uniref:Uncharacterized protein n=1 Tax=Iamia majanohamensis TaxID=467976 RepID=A0AAF0BVU7_9ACTN|nr:hypothetical protein [Iamia majanohamensis]WCO69217.1 hypothetical protein PO878_10830 [Iamia majanohamensis]